MVRPPRLTRSSARRARPPDVPIERELKLLTAAAGAPQLPSGWTLGSGALHQLRDTYLEAGGALARAGVALRSRRARDPRGPLHRAARGPPGPTGSGGAAGAGGTAIVATHPRRIRATSAKSESRVCWVLMSSSTTRRPWDPAKCHRLGSSYENPNQRSNFPARVPQPQFIRSSGRRGPGRPRCRGRRGPSPSGWRGSWS